MKVLALYISLIAVASAITYTLSHFGNDPLWIVAAITTFLFLKGLIIDTLGARHD